MNPKGKGWELNVKAVIAFADNHDWLPDISGEGLKGCPCIKPDNFDDILFDGTKSEAEKASLVSQFTCRKASNLECNDENKCECMIFGNKRGEWHQDHLKCYHPVGGSCTTRSLLFPGMPAKTMFKPVCVRFAKCEAIHPLSNHTCTCDEDWDAKPDASGTHCLVENKAPSSVHFSMFWIFWLSSLRCETCSEIFVVCAVNLIFMFQSTLCFSLL